MRLDRAVGAVIGLSPGARFLRIEQHVNAYPDVHRNLAVLVLGTIPPRCAAADFDNSGGCGSFGAAAGVDDGLSAVNQLGVCRADALDGAVYSHAAGIQRLPHDPLGGDAVSSRFEHRHDPADSYQRPG